MNARGQFSITFVLLLAAAHAATARPLTEVGSRRLDRISTNADGLHTCVVKEDGTARCWGFNSGGQLGDGSITNRPAPVQVSRLTGAASIATGDFHTCALLFSGAVSCWGSNSSGQLGTGNTIQALTPVAVAGLGTATAIAAGNSHTCAVLVDGTVRCWGRNEQGELGDGTTQQRPLPTLVPGVTNAVDVAAGSTHTCALIADGTMRCWGANASGQIGNGTTGGPVLTATVVSGMSNAVAIAAGSFHSCAVRSDGSAKCWGANSQGGLGDGTQATRTTPVTVVGITTAVSLAAGNGFTCLLLAGGTVQCVGVNTFGQLGDGTTTSPRLAPVSVTGLVRATAVSGGNGFACALDATDTVRCWGSNTNTVIVIGELGNGSTTLTFSATPVLVTGLNGSISARGVAGGGLHTCARRAASSEACWGDNNEGQIGNNTTNTASLPAAVKTIGAIKGGGTGLVDLTAVTAVSAGGNHSCSMTGTGAVLCWGFNNHGQLGSGTINTNALLPGAVTGLTNASAIAAGRFHTCAITQPNGIAKCWGNNGSGQLGNGQTGTDSITPVNVSGGVFINGQLTSVAQTNLSAVAAGDSHTCALTGDGHVLCWGDNHNGQLGNGNSIMLSSNIPVLVSGVTNATAIAAGGSHTCALLAIGNVSCWGLNTNGQLGNNGTTTSFLPVAVTTLGIGLEGFVPLNGVTAIGAGLQHTCALNSGGRVQCWGDGGLGQLGTGNTGDAHFPLTFVQENVIEGVFDLPAIVALGIGRTHSCALNVQGGVACWGNNSFGQLGSGSTGGISTQAFGTISSFNFNIDPNVVLSSNGRIATVTVIANCRAGQQAHIELELTQGTVSGTGRGVGKCEGDLERYPVTVAAQGPNGFASGPAQATADALVEGHGAPATNEHWTRQVSLDFQ